MIDKARDALVGTIIIGMMIGAVKLVILLIRLLIRIIFA